jgi:hypothetical protein
METHAVAELPTTFYVVVGILVAGNLGLILALLTIIFKAGRFVTATELGITNNDKKSDKAHERLDRHGVRLSALETKGVPK